MRIVATLSCLLIVALAAPGPVAGAGDSASPVPSAALAPADAPAEPTGPAPACVEAFAEASARSAASDLVTAAASPAPDRLDATIRACASFAAWVLGALDHPGAVNAADVRAILAERCVDAGTDLGDTRPCQELFAPAATPRPVITPAPTPEPTPAFVPSDATSGEPAIEDELVRLPRKLKRKVPGATKIRYVSIRGATARELEKDAAKRLGRRCDSDDPWACVSQKRLVKVIETTNLRTGACTITKVTVGRSSVVFLPRWTSPKRVDREVLEWWGKMLDRFAWHEGRHISIQNKRISEFSRALPGKPCSAFRRELRQLDKAIRRAQREFHRREREKPFPLAP